MPEDTPDFRSMGTKLMQGIPVLILNVLVSVFISCSTAGFVLIQLIASGHNRYLSLVLALFLAIAIHFFIRLNHKIQAFINNSLPDKKLKKQ